LIYLKITIIGALVVPLLRYNFGIINWRLVEIRKIDRKTRKVLTMYKMHYPETVIDGLYVKRKVTNRSDISSKDNQYCRIFKHKMYRRPVCKYC